MNRETGKLITNHEFLALKETNPTEAKKYVQVSHATPEQIKRGHVRLTDLCACGSRKKFKDCCFKFRKPKRKKISRHLEGRNEPACL